MNVNTKGAKYLDKHWTSLDIYNRELRIIFDLSKSNFFYFLKYGIIMKRIIEKRSTK